MLLVALGIFAFIVAFAGWRWGLGSRNWLEGVIVALVAAILSATLLHTAQRHGARLSHPRRSNLTGSGPGGFDIR